MTLPLRSVESVAESLFHRAVVGAPRGDLASAGECLRAALVLVEERKAEFKRPAVAERCECGYHFGGEVPAGTLCGGCRREMADERRLS